MLTGTFDQARRYPWYWNFTIFYSDENEKFERVLLEKWGKFPSFAGMVEGMIKWVGLIRERDVKNEFQMKRLLHWRATQREDKKIKYEAVGYDGAGVIPLERSDFKVARRF